MTPPDQTLAVLTEDLRARVVERAKSARPDWGGNLTVTVSAELVLAYDAALTAQEEEAKRLREALQELRTSLGHAASDANAEHDSFDEVHGSVNLTALLVGIDDALSAALHAPQPHGIGSPTGDA